MTNVSSTKQSMAGRDLDLPDRIRESALEDIRRFGILGLRVTRVAKRAHCSVTQIYRHFDDRDGLLADVLAGIFEQITTRNIENTISALTAMPELTIPNMVAILPGPSQAATSEEALLRSQILAVATVNPLLRMRLSEIARSVWPKWELACEIVEQRLPPGENFDRRVVFTVLLNTNLFYNSLLGDHAVTDDEYREFMIDAFRMRSSSKDPDRPDR